MKFGTTLHYHISTATLFYSYKDRSETGCKNTSQNGAELRCCRSRI